MSSCRRRESVENRVFITEIPSIIDRVPRNSVPNNPRNQRLRLIPADAKDFGDVHVDKRGMYVQPQQITDCHYFGTVRYGLKSLFLSNYAQFQL